MTDGPVSEEPHSGVRFRLGQFLYWAFFLAAVLVTITGIATVAFARAENKEPVIAVIGLIVALAIWLVGKGLRRGLSGY